MSRVAKYLVVLYRLEESESPPVATGRIAKEVDRSPSATTEMIQRLEAEQLVEHEPYSGVTLTQTGREQARELHKSYRTLCRFFREVLELENPEPEALEVVGTVSPMVVRRLAHTILPPESDSTPSDLGRFESRGPHEGRR